MATFLLTAGSTANRWLDIETPLAKGDMIIERVTGTETLGRLFEYEVLVLSNRNNLPFDDVLGKHVTVMMEVDDTGFQPRRAVDGRVAQMGLLGAVQNFDNLYRYRLVLRPWLWMLTRTRDCRIFQSRTTEVILREIFEDHTDVHFDFRLTGTYATREYCVQYRESDYDFISRLMEEEGIYYFFEHEKGKHTMVLCDAPSNHQSVGSVRMRNDDHRAGAIGPQIHQWTVTSEIQPGAFAMRDYNFETPDLTLDAISSAERPHSESLHEVFDYPGVYEEVKDGDPGEKPEGSSISRKRLEEIQVAHQLVEGRGDSRQLVCGALFTLTHHLRGDQNQEHLVIDASIDAENNLPELETQTSFDCRFRLLRGDMQYRSPRITPRPVVQGPQTAVVVGPEGEEIHVDKYGRVKIQFHWDRRGKNNDESSCWVRVSQAWAGKDYGWMTIPRIDQEVVIDFLEGNPDRPLITGRVYNAQQMPAWALPDNKTQSGIRTRSSPGGSVDNFNELRFEDKKGEELVNIHAEKNMNTHVENDASRFVGNDCSTIIKHDATRYVENDDKFDVKRDQTSTVGRNTKIGIVGTLDTTVEQAATHIYNNSTTVVNNATYVQHVKPSFLLSVTGTRHEKVTGTASRQLMANSEEMVAGDVMAMASNFKYTATGNFEYFGMKFDRTVMEANDTFLGANTSTYIGASSSTEVAGARNTFVGVKNELDLAISISTFIGLKASLEASASVSATIGPQMSFAALGLADKPLDVAKAGISIDTATLHLINGGAAAAGAAPAAAAAGPGAAVAAFALGFAGGSAVANAVAAFMDLKEFPEVNVSAVLVGMLGAATGQNTWAYGQMTEKNSPGAAALSPQNEYGKDSAGNKVVTKQVVPEPPPEIPAPPQGNAVAPAGPGGGGGGGSKTGGGGDKGGGSGSNKGGPGGSAPGGNSKNSGGGSTIN